MQLVFTMSLPREEATVPVVRHLCRASLERLGVLEGCLSDVELAVTEACTNVLRHASVGEDEYDVSIKITDGVCDIQVVDRGAPFDHARLTLPQATDEAESGRGIYLMRALVDDLHFVAQPEAGMAVHLTKSLQLRDGAALERLLARRRDGARLGS